MSAFINFVYSCRHIAAVAVLLYIGYISVDKGFTLVETLLTLILIVNCAIFGRLANKKK